MAEEPKGLMKGIGRVMADHEMIGDFQGWEGNPGGSGGHFCWIIQLTWMSRHTPVDDL